MKHRTWEVKSTCGLSFPAVAAAKSASGLAEKKPFPVSGESTKVPKSQYIQ